MTKIKYHYILALSIILASSLFFIASMPSADAFRVIQHTSPDSVQVSKYIQGFEAGGSYWAHGFDKQFHAVSADRLTDLSEYDPYDSFITFGQVSFGPNSGVEIQEDGRVFITTTGQDTVILTEAQFKALTYKRPGMDYNSAPSQGGLSTVDAPRITWNECVIGTPAIHLTASHIFIAEGHAICANIQAFFDGVPLPDTLFIGDLREDEDFRSFGGKEIELPFSAYHMTDDNGTLYSIPPGIEAGILQVFNTDNKVEHIQLTKTAVRLIDELYAVPDIYQAPTPYPFWK